MEVSMSLVISVSDSVPSDVDAVAFAVFSDLSSFSEHSIESVAATNRGFGGALAETMVSAEASGQLAIAVGLGAREKSLDAEDVRRIGAALAGAAKKCTSLAIELSGIASTQLSAVEVARALGEGAGLASYHFDRFKTEATKDRLERVIVVSSAPGLADAASAANAVVEVVSLCRDLVNTPAGDLSPSDFASIAEDVAARVGLGIEVFKKDKITEERLGGLLGVAAGSAQPPRFVRLSYEPEGVTNPPTVALVGKGITFDSGGLSIKPASSMMTMKDDMSGAAAVLSTMAACGRLGVKVRVLGYMPLTENMPGDAATRPGDILRIRNGKTIEVLNTDAEGRLVLADALSLAVEEQPDAIIDLATLTGACVVALGKEIAGLLGNDDALIAAVERAGAAAGEALWELPIPAGYHDHIDSDVADMKNIGATGQAGSLSAALLLQEFVGEVPWVHLDIAGPAFTEKNKHYVRKGGTGFGVRTLLALLDDYEPLGRGASGDAKGIRVLR
jgi:leucyl aminopeptidase